MAFSQCGVSFLAVTAAVLYIAFFVSPAHSIMCYQCNTQLHEGCGQLAYNDTHSEYYKECDGEYEGEEPFCRKTVVEIKTVAPRIVRSCGWKNHTHNCYHIDDGHHIENVCQCYTDGCNTAATNHVAAFVLVATTLLLRLTV